MARFTSVHPLHFTEPPLRFQLEGDHFVLDTDEDAVIDAMRALPAEFHVVEVVSDDLEERTIPQLQAYAVEYGIELSGASKKADIVAAIRSHFTAPEQPSGGEPDTTPVVLASSDADAESQPVDAVDDHGDTE
ncbi:hypothetical protein GCM10009740_31420 [Terrabacter terrae]|uniref:Rho termination factor-like N-terminal domain-containing protein n=1 Tax=Terrabacter terrae TaxID=318434 RepID=A0ABP5FZH2_9MICO